MHLGDIGIGQWIGGCRSSLAALRCLIHRMQEIVLAGQTAKRDLRLIRLLLVDNCGNEATSVAVRTFDHHHPDIRILGNDVDIITVMRTMAHATRTQSLQHDFPDAIFIGVHDRPLYKLTGAHVLIRARIQVVDIQRIDEVAEYRQRFVFVRSARTYMFVRFGVILSRFVLSNVDPRAIHD